MERQGSAGQQRSVTGPPALQIQTGVQPQRPVQAAEPQGAPYAAPSQFPPRKSSMHDQERPDLTTDSAVYPPRTSSRPQSPVGGPGVRSPPLGAASSAAPKIVRPSEIYRRMEEEKERERRSIDSARRSSVESAGGEGSGPEGALRSPRRPSLGRNDDSGDGSRSLQPLATVDERKSEYGFDGLMINPGTQAAPPAEAKASSDRAAETTRDMETRPGEKPSLATQSPPPTLQHPMKSDEAGPAQEPKKRFSLSPKLPDFARMSGFGFGTDFFSGSGGLTSESPKQPEAPAEATPMPALESGPAGSKTSATGSIGRAVDEKTAALAQDPSVERFSYQQIPEPHQPKPLRPTLPGGWVSETASTPGEMATPGNEQARYGLNVNPGSISTISEHAEDPSLKPAPLRTPTPRGSSPKKFDDDKSSSRSAQPSPHMPLPLRTTPVPSSSAQQLVQPGATPTPAKSEAETDAQQASAPAPLQPRKGSEPNLQGEGIRHPVMRVDTVSTADNSSPLKESDVLRDEIIRSLSPVRSSDRHLDTLPDESAARESAYLSDVYGDYWTAEEPMPGQQREQNVGEPKSLGLTKEEHGSASASATSTPPAHDLASSRREPFAVAASEPEPAKSDLKRERFSWEAAAEDNKSAAASPAKHPLPDPPREEASPSSAAVDLDSPADSGRLSPLLTLPVLSLGLDGEDSTRDEDGPSRDVLEDRKFPPGQDTSTVQTPSPGFHTGDHYGPSDAADRGSMAFSHSDEKIVLASPSSPTSPTSDASPSAQPLRAISPVAEATPTNIPLPESPAKGSGEDNKPSSSSQQHVMNLKQIMTLPTSPERVYKMLEARSEFAAMPSGLGEWLSQLLAQPEHANAGPGFKYPPAGDDLPLFANNHHRHRRHTNAAGAEGDGTGEVGRQHSGTGLSMAGGGSVRIPGASSAQLQLGNLMHGQAGTKGKELLQSAGKMGKGLLSKGRHKLRERAESKKG